MKPGFSVQDIQDLISVVKQNMETSKEPGVRYIGLTQSREVVLFESIPFIRAGAWNQFIESAVIVVNYNIVNPISEQRGSEGTILLKGVKPRFNISLNWYSQEPGTELFEHALWIVVSGCIQEIRQREKSKCLTLYSYKPHKP